MKLVEDNEVMIGSAGDTKKFSIATSAKAFKILSSGLYKNKIRAVVRELACNCLDAHKLNGFEGKFDIQVPTQLDPRFIIRDFGPGLASDDVMNLYTTYFASTKSNSNDFIGALGLGSKSPFSYTETFTVVSYHKGTVSGYTAMLDKGEPVIRPLYTEAMGLEDKEGIEITVPVKIGDITRWKEEIAYVVRPFGEAKVNILNDAVKPEYFPEFENFYGTGTRNYGHPEQQGIWAVYGNIVYPLNAVPGLKNNWLTYKYGLTYIRFPLGELDIAASREELSLDEATIKNILTRVNSISDNLLKDDLKEYDNETNERKLTRDLSALTYNAQNILKARATKFGPNKLSIVELQRRFEPIDALLEGVVYETIFEPKLKRIKRSPSNSRVASLNNVFGYNVKNVYIVEDDVPSKRLEAMRALYAAISDTTKTPSDKLKQIRKEVDDGRLPSRHKDVIFYNSENIVQMANIGHVKKLFKGDNVQVFKTSEMLERFKEWIPVKAPREKGVRPKAPTGTSFKFEKGQWVQKEEYFRAADIDDLEGYVILQSRNEYLSVDLKVGSLNGSVNSFALRELATLAGIKEFYVIRPTLHAKVRKVGVMECFIEEVVEKYAEAIDKVDYDEYPSSSGRVSSFTRHIDKHPKILGNMIQYFNTSGKSTPEAKKLIEFNRYLRNYAVYNGAEYTVRNKLNLANSIFSKLQNFANTRLSDKITSFEVTNSVACYFMCNKWDITEEQAKELAMILKLDS